LNPKICIVRVSEKTLTYGKSFVIRNKVPYYGTISVSRRSVIVHTIEASVVHPRQNRKKTYGRPSNDAMKGEVMAKAAEISRRSGFKLVDEDEKG